MQVKVKWDTDGYSLEELGLQEVVTIPTINSDDVADYLSDEYGYCVESFAIVDLDSGYYQGEKAWLLSDDGNDVVVLIGGHTLEEALEAKEQYDSYDECSDIVWMHELEWLECQDLSGEWAEQYEC